VKTETLILDGFSMTTSSISCSLVWSFHWIHHRANNNWFFFFFFHGHLKTKINIPYCSYFGHVLLYICVRTSAFDRKRLVTWMPVYVRISDCAEWWVVRRKLKLNMVTTPSRTESKKLSRQLLILLKEMDPKAGMILGTDLVFSPRSFFLLSFIFYLVFFMPFIFLSVLIHFQFLFMLSFSLLPFFSLLD